MTKDEEWLLREKYGGTATPEFEDDRERLAAGEPLSYVIGSQPFLGLTIFLDSKPLIPRVETEWWTEQMLTSLQNEQRHLLEERPEPRDQKFPASQASQELGSTLRGNGARQSKFPATLFSYERSELEKQEVLFSGAENYAAPKVSDSVRLIFLDLCAGSGAIGCAALARLPHAQVYFGELDPTHEPTIRKNIRENDLDESRATIGIGDLFEPFGETQFDIIAVNPPYIPFERPISASVADYEPALALYGGTDGLALIRRIAEELPKRLTKGGIAWIECDSAHAKEACALFIAQGLVAEIRTDQYEVPRLVVVSFAS